MESIARVNPKYFAAISLFQAVSDVRYYLCGVYIEPHPEKGVVIVATDGHTLGLLHDPDGWVKSPIIVGDISKSLVTACASNGSKRRPAPAHLYLSEKGAVVDTEETPTKEVNPFSDSAVHMSKIKLVDGAFPNWRRVVEQNRVKGTEFPCVNSIYLARLDAAMKILNTQGRYYGGIELMSSGRETTMIARFPQPDLEQRFLALIMPMRNEQPKNLLPDWLMPREEPQADQATA